MLGHSVKNYRKTHPPLNTTLPETHLIFQEFLDFSINQFREKHWRQYDRICRPCQVKYNYIFKYKLHY